MADTMQQLTATRAQLYVDAYDSAEAAKIMTFVSPDVSFTEESFGVVDISYDAYREFLATSFSSFSSFNIVKHEATGTAEFTALEMTARGVLREDNPALEALNAKAGDTVELLGVSLLWWRWEGEGEADISAKGAKGWKIWKQKEYFHPKAGK